MTDTDTAALIRKMLTDCGQGRIGHIEARAALKRVRELLPILDTLLQRSDSARARQRLRELARAVAEAGEHLNTAGGHFSKTRRALELIVTHSETDGP
jgi:hypothetical protein